MRFSISPFKAVGLVLATALLSGCPRCEEAPELELTHNDERVVGTWIGGANPATKIPSYEYPGELRLRADGSFALYVTTESGGKDVFGYWAMGDGEAEEQPFEFAVTCSGFEAYPPGSLLSGQALVSLREDGLTELIEITLTVNGVSTGSELRWTLLNPALIESNAER